MSEEPLIHRQLMRMHGFGLMNMILTQLSTEHHIILQVSGAPSMPRGSANCNSGTRKHEQMEITDQK